MEGLTYGLELEWSDVDKRIELPAGAEWNWDDYTIVNTDGHANDPTGASYIYGAEINTIPTSTIDEQIEVVKKLAKLLNPATTYRAALHIHIAHESLIKDINLLQKFFAYALANENDFFRIAWRKTPYIGSPEQTKIANKWHTTNDRIFVGKVPPNRVKEIQQAKTPREFYEAHAPFSEKTGKRVWHLSARAGINMKSLFKHGTVEFRCFAGSHDPDEIKQAMEWCEQFFIHALTDQLPVRQFKLPTKLPLCPPFNEIMEQRYQATKFKGTTNGRSRISN